MKKLFISVFLICLGAGAWWATARTARFSIKKWDAKFESVLRHGLTDVGLTDHDLVSSTHEIKKDMKGEWVSHKVSLNLPNPEKQKELADELEDAGAKVQRMMDGRVPMLVVKRGSRTYQEIRFENENSRNRNILR